MSQIQVDASFQTADQSPVKFHDVTLLLPSASITVGELVALVLVRCRALQRGSTIVDSKDIHVWDARKGVRSNIMEPRHYGEPIPGGQRLYLSAPFFAFRLGPVQSHVMLFAGKKVILHPAVSGYRKAEDLCEWLNGARVREYGSLNAARWAGGRSAGVRSKERIMRVAKAFCIWGGGHGFLLSSVTVEFDSDRAAVRTKLNTIKQRIDSGDVASSEFPARWDFDTNDLLIPETDDQGGTAIRHVNKAMVTALWLAQHHFSLEQTPFAIFTEPSGNSTLGRWQPNVPDLHGTLVFVNDVKELAGDVGHIFPQAMEQYLWEFGLVLKGCRTLDHTQAIKTNMNYPQTVYGLWIYHFKLPGGPEKCCYVEEYGKSTWGYLLMVRKFKDEHSIPCGRYPTVAKLEVPGCPMLS